MPPVRTLEHTDQGIRVDFTQPIPGLDKVKDENGLTAYRLWLPKAGLTLTKVRNTIKTLGLDTDTVRGFKVAVLSDALSPNGIAVSVSDRPQLATLSDPLPP